MEWQRSIYSTLSGLGGGIVLLSIVFLLGVIRPHDFVVLAHIQIGVSLFVGLPLLTALNYVETRK